MPRHPGDRRQLEMPPCCLIEKYYRRSLSSSLLADPAPRFEIAGHRRRKDSPQRIGEPDLGILPSGILCLIDTHIGSPNRRYVMRALPLEWRLEAKFEISSRSASFSRQPEGIPSIP